MSYPILHTITWLNPDEPAAYQWEQKFYQGDIPTLEGYIKPIQTFESVINTALRVDLDFYQDFLFWGYSEGTPNCFLTLTASYDPLFGVLEIYTDWENQYVDTITRVTIPAEEHGFYNFQLSNVVEDSNDPEDVDYWWDLPKTLTWNNDKDKEGSAPHVFVHLKMEGAPYGLQVPVLPFGNLPKILSRHQGCPI